MNSEDDDLFRDEFARELRAAIDHAKVHGPTPFTHPCSPAPSETEPVATGSSASPADFAKLGLVNPAETYAVEKLGERRLDSARIARVRLDFREQNGITDVGVNPKIARIREAQKRGQKKLDAGDENSGNTVDS